MTACRLPILGTLLVATAILGCTVTVPVAVTGASPSPGIKSNSPSPKPSPSNAITPTVAPASPAVAHVYTLPLVVIDVAECGGGIRQIYAVSASGELTQGTEESFTGTPAPPRPPRQLDNAEREALLALLTRLDLANAAERNTVVEGGTQTTECRSVRSYAMGVDGKDQTFSGNARATNYDDTFRAEIAELEGRLKALATVASVGPSPGLPQ